MKIEKSITNLLSPLSALSLFLAFPALLCTGAENQKNGADQRAFLQNS